MTNAAKLKPRPVRKQVTEPMTEQPVKSKHHSPIVIDSHLDDVSVISSAAYVRDASNRWAIHSYEVKQLWYQHVSIFNVVKPYAVKAYDTAKEAVTKK